MTGEIRNLNLVNLNFATAGEVSQRNSGQCGRVKKEGGAFSSNLASNSNLRSWFGERLLWGSGDYGIGFMG